VWVEHEWLEHPAVRDLVEKGHHIMDLVQHETGGPAHVPDLILARSAHNWTDEMFLKPAFLAMAMKAARARRKG